MELPVGAKLGMHREKKKKKRAEMQSQGSGFECGHSFGGTMHHGGLVLLVLLKCHSNTADN